MSNNLAFITRMFEKTRHNDFTYVADPTGCDRWKVHKELNAFHGDCDDFAMTFAYRAMGADSGFLCLKENLSSIR